MPLRQLRRHRRRRLHNLLRGVLANRQHPILVPRLVVALLMLCLLHVLVHRKLRRPLLFAERRLAVRFKLDLYVDEPLRPRLTLCRQLLLQLLRGLRLHGIHRLPQRLLSVLLPLHKRLVGLVHFKLQLRLCRLVRRHDLFHLDRVLGLGVL